MRLRTLSGLVPKRYRRTTILAIDDFEPAVFAARIRDSPSSALERRETRA
jgi:hypothetical protein